METVVYFCQMTGATCMCANAFGCLYRSAGIVLSLTVVGAVQALLAQGRKIMAIKLVREVTSHELKTCKEIVDCVEEGKYIERFESAHFFFGS